MKTRTVIFIMLIFSLSSLAAADTMTDIYNRFRNDSDSRDIETFQTELSQFTESKDFSFLVVQQREMANLVVQMQNADSAAEIDSLMISYLEKSREILLKNQWYILFVTILLSLLVIIISAVVFYIILVEEKKRIAKEILLELERERSRISFELHDTVAQEITSVSLILKSGGKTDDAQKLLENAQKEIRGILSALNPPSLEESSVETLMGELCSSFEKSNGIECSLNVSEDFSSLIFTAEEKFHIFRIVQEALANIQKHAKASSVQVIFRRNGAGKKGYVFFVCDDGIGFSGQKNDGKHHFGLKSIEQRVAILGGSLKITSDSQNGTTIRVEAL